jgi:hypothetical protein
MNFIILRPIKTPFLFGKGGDLSDRFMNRPFEIDGPRLKELVINLNNIKHNKQLMSISNDEWVLRP